MLYWLIFTAIVSLFLIVPTMMQFFVSPVLAWQILVTFSLAFLLSNAIYTMIYITAIKDRLRKQGDKSNEPPEL